MKYLLFLSSALASVTMASCSSVPGGDGVNASFSDLYSTALKSKTYITRTGIEPKSPSLSFFAKNNCSFAHPKLAVKLGKKRPAPAQTEEKESALVAGILSKLAVDTVTGFLKAAGEDRTETTPVEGSFTLSTGGPKCFLIGKDAGKKGQFLLELGLEESTTPGVFRLLPTYINFEQKQKRHILNSGKRTIAVEGDFGLQGSSEKVKVVLNLGDWREGEESYLNAEAYKDVNEPNVNIASSWFDLKTTDASTPINVEFRVLETTSASQLAKVLGAEAETNSARLETEISNLINTPAATFTSPSDNDYFTNRDKDLCAPLETELKRMISQGTVSEAKRNQLSKVVDELNKVYGSDFPEISSYTIYDKLPDAASSDQVKALAQDHYDTAFGDICPRSAS